MATSTEIFDHRIQNFLKNCPVDSYLDIGIGEGKMGKMVRKINKKARIVGIEPSQDVIDKCPKNIYDKIEKKFANDLINSFPDFRVGMVLMGDVLEHMKKSEGMDFINFILYRCEYLLIKYPPVYLQFAVEGPHDGHISMWFPTDFEQFHCPIEINEIDDYMALTVMKGLIGIAKGDDKRFKIGDMDNIRII